MPGRCRPVRDETARHLSQRWEEPQSRRPKIARRARIDTTIATLQSQCRDVADPDYRLSAILSGNDDRPNAIADNVHATHSERADGCDLAHRLLLCGGFGLPEKSWPKCVCAGYWAADTSIFKNFRISAKFRLQFRPEAFNVFNRANFQPGNAEARTGNNRSLSSLRFGRTQRPRSCRRTRHDPEKRTLPVRR